MEVPFEGGCACGQIRYRSEGEPKFMINCHCRDCQQATGGAYFPGIMIKKDKFTLLSGEPTWFMRPSDTGNDMGRAFCPDCGSPLFLTNSSNDRIILLYASSLDDPSGFEPSHEIFVKSAQPWTKLHDHIPHCDEMPG